MSDTNTPEFEILGTRPNSCVNVRLNGDTTATLSFSSKDQKYRVTRKGLYDTSPFAIKVPFGTSRAQRIALRKEIERLANEVYFAEVDAARVVNRIEYTRKRISEMERMLPILREEESQLYERLSKLRTTA